MLAVDEEELLGSQFAMIKPESARVCLSNSDTKVFAELIKLLLIQIACAQ